MAAILLAATAAANPVASPALIEHLESRGLTVTSMGLSPITDGNLQERGIQVTHESLTPINDRDLEERDADIEKRSRPKIHNCGSDWQPIENRGEQYGFKAAVSAFCNAADGIKVPHGMKYSSQIDGLTLTYHTKGHLAGRVYNRHVEDGFVIKAQECTESLYLFDDPRAKCYGKNNKDTKGGKVDTDFGNWEAYPTPDKGY